jgi:hypothetical protein
MGRPMARRSDGTYYTERIAAADLKARRDELRAREAADTRTPLQRWLGDPPPDRCALARETQHSVPRNALRHD